MQRATQSHAVICLLDQAGRTLTDGITYCEVVARTNGIRQAVERKRSTTLSGRAMSDGHDDQPQKYNSLHLWNLGVPSSPQQLFKLDEANGFQKSLQIREKIFHQTLSVEQNSGVCGTAPTQNFACNSRI